MTLDGTNTYLIGAPGSGGVVVVDPGPDLIAHFEAIEAAAAERDAEPAAVILTHHHVDHAEAAGWADVWGVQRWAFTPSRIPGSQPLRDGETLSIAGVDLVAVHTPGHCDDHLCLRVAGSGTVLTGDHVLGRGTTVIAWPDGDMSAYLESLQRLSSLGATELYPGHGPVVDQPQLVIDEYLHHRLERERQVLDALEAGDATAAQIVQRVYAEVDEALHPAAALSVRAHLAKLVADGLVKQTTSSDSEPDVETFVRG